MFKKFTQTFMESIKQRSWETINKENIKGPVWTEKDIEREEQWINEKSWKGFWRRTCAINILYGVQLLGLIVGQIALRKGQDHDIVNILMACVGMFIMMGWMGYVIHKVNQREEIINEQLSIIGMMITTVSMMMSIVGFKTGINGGMWWEATVIYMASNVIASAAIVLFWPSYNKERLNKVKKESCKAMVQWMQDDEDIKNYVQNIVDEGREIREFERLNMMHWIVEKEENQRLKTMDQENEAACKKLYGMEV